MSPLKNYTEAAAWLGVPRKWLEDQVQKGKVPHTRLGRHVRFTEGHLNEIVAAGEQREKTKAAPAPASQSIRPAPPRRKRSPRKS